MTGDYGEPVYDLRGACENRVLGTKGRVAVGLGGTICRIESVVDLVAETGRTIGSKTVDG